MRIDWPATVAKKSHEYNGVYGRMESSRSDRPPRTDLPSAALSLFEKEFPAANPITFKKDVLALCSAIVPLAEGNAKLLPPDAPGTLTGDSRHSAAQ
jgi:hypothetical protein